MADYMPTRSTRNDNNNNGKKRRKWPFILFGLIVFLIIGGFFGLRTYYNNQLEPVDPDAGESAIKEIEVPSGSSISDIASILEDEGMIHDATVFQLYTRFNDANNLQAGYYELSPSQSTIEIVETLQEGGSDVSSESMTSITIPEGSNVLQIAEIISTQLDFTTEEVFDVIENEAFISEMFEKYPAIFEDYPTENPDIIYTLEGYLYPATYDYNIEDSLESLIEQMVANTNNVYSQVVQDIESESFTFHELLTLGAIVEHEAANEEDRRLIAGVFLNRLAIDMPLETNVSFSYLEGEHKETVSYEDTEVESPYNLYMYPGIGPGPINNPSINSVEAVINPEESDYYFFLSDIYTEETYFSETYAEHLEKQEIYVNSYTSE